MLCLLAALISVALIYFPAFPVFFSLVYVDLCTLKSERQVSGRWSGSSLVEELGGMDGVSERVPLSGAGPSLLPPPRIALCDAAGSAAPDTCPPPCRPPAPSAPSRGWEGAPLPTNNAIRAQETSLTFSCHHHPIVSWKIIEYSLFEAPSSIFHSSAWFFI